MDRRIGIAKRIISKYGYIQRCSLSDSSSTEEKVCLRHCQDGWCTYYVERGAIYDRVVYNDIDAACVGLIVQAVIDKCERRQAVEDYLSMLVFGGDENTRKKTINFLIESAVAQLTV